MRSSWQAYLRVSMTAFLFALLLWHHLDSLPPLVIIRRANFRIGHCGTTCQVICPLASIILAARSRPGVNSQG
jgi:hypothetical protein